MSVRRRVIELSRSSGADKSYLQLEWLYVMQSLGERRKKAKKVIITRKPMRTRFTDRTTSLSDGSGSRLAARDLEAVDSRRQLNYYFSLFSLSCCFFCSQI